MTLTPTTAAQIPTNTRSLKRREDGMAGRRLAWESDLIRRADGMLLNTLLGWFAAPDRVRTR